MSDPIIPVPVPQPVAPCLCDWRPTINSALLVVTMLIGLFNAHDLNSRPHSPTADAIAEKVAEKTPTADAVADKVIFRTATPPALPPALPPAKAVPVPAPVP